MDGPKTISWIFFAIALSSERYPAKFSGISMMADGINHAVPTGSELQTSIKWLISRELILKEGKKYSLTDSGRNMLSSARDHSGTLLKMWEALEQEIRELL